MRHRKYPRVEYRCSFCGKSQEQVHRLVAGPGGVYICDECIRLCDLILKEEEIASTSEGAAVPAVREEQASSAEPASDPRALWNRKAAFWDERFGEGNQFHRRLVEPAALRLLDVRPDAVILDVACGNGAFSRRLVSLGAEVVAFDFSEVFIERARARTTEQLDRIEYHVIDAMDSEALLSLGEQRFDAAVANMALMDIADIQPLASALSLLLKPLGSFVFSVQHPCFNSNAISFTAESALQDGKVVRTSAIKVSGYLDVPAGEGVGIPGEPNPHIYFHRPLNELCDVFFRQGFMIDGVEEPAFDPSNETLGWDAVGGQIPPVLAVRLRLTERRGEGLLPSVR